MAMLLPLQDNTQTNGLVLTPQTSLLVKPRLADCRDILGNLCVSRECKDAVTELNLLGNLGSSSFRKAGDLYGVILLPESATGADIEAARKLLIDRGAADGTTTNNLYTAWYQRDDIVEFKHINTSGVTSANNAWGLSDNLAIFPPLDLSSCGSFRETWQSCSALTSFPSGAKLGTAANNVNFSNAWESSGLTSFPALDLSNGTTFYLAFAACASLTTIDEGILSGTAVTAATVNFNSTFLGSGIESLPPNLDLSREIISIKHLRDALR